MVYHSRVVFRLISGPWASLSRLPSPLLRLDSSLLEQGQFCASWNAFLLTVTHILVGDGHTESAQYTVHWCFPLSSSSGVRRKRVDPYYRSRSHETRLYDRGVKGLPPRPADGLSYRFETLIGVTGFKLAKYRATWLEVLSAPFKLVWRPHLLLALVFEVRLYFQYRDLTRGQLSHA